MKKAICIMLALFVSAAVLFLAGHPWLGGISLYLGATMFVLLLIHGANAKAMEEGVKDREDGLSSRHA